jgi:hypothetical protein
MGKIFECIDIVKMLIYIEETPPPSLEHHRTYETYPL